MSPAALFCMLEMSETAFLGIVTKVELPERLSLTLNVEESVEDTEAHCLVEGCYEMVAASTCV